jgi:hypothetical protein
VVILGVSGWNGPDRIDIDRNPSYLDAVPLSAHPRGLELYRLDLAEKIVDLEPVEIVHAALSFDHAGIVRCLENAVRLVVAGGALSVSNSRERVTQTWRPLHSHQCRTRALSPI